MTGNPLRGPTTGAALALLLLALVLAAGCAEEKSKAAPKEIPALGTPLIPDKYFKDLGGCLKYLDAVDKCIYNRATALKIGQLCEPIQSPELRVTCLMDIAPMTGVRSLCLQAGAKRDDCFEKMAVERNEADDCLQIQASERQGICLKNLAVKYKTPAYCEKIMVGGLRDSCFAKTAVDARDFEACGRIADDTTKEACQNIVGQATGVEAYCS